ncbi:hypothetical protein ABKU43_21815, partial [Enterobacter hormaechei]
ILSLIQRHFDVSEGDIRFHDVPLPRLLLDDWRSRLTQINGQSTEGNKDESLTRRWSSVCRRRKPARRLLKSVIDEVVVCDTIPLSDEIKALPN